jgi:exocyst complex protein 7
MGIVSRLAVDLEKQIGELKQPIFDTVKPIRETAKGSLPRMLEDTRSRVQSLIALPIDGGAVQVTGEIMTRLQTMTGYLDELASVMRSLGDGGWSNQPTSPTGSLAPSIKSFDVGADGQDLFAHYASDTIEALLNSLDSRSRLLHKGNSLQGVFLVNNIAIIDRMIRSSELQPLLAGVAPRIIEKWNKMFSRRYMDVWQEPARYLFDQQHTNRMRPPSGGGPADSASVIKALGSKEKDAIKEKFRQFNASFDDLVGKHKSYGMEREVRTQFAKEITALVEPLYRRFWEKYHDIDKGKGKYVKYDKNQMAAILASLG